jgi:hypothetical protein
MMLFVQENALIAGLYLTGAYSFASPTLLSSAEVVCQYPAAGVMTLDLTLGGVAQGLNIQVAASAGPGEFNQTVPLAVVAQPGQTARWVVVSFNGGVGNESGYVSITVASAPVAPTLDDLANSGLLLSWQGRLYAPNKTGDRLANFTDATASGAAFEISTYWRRAV